MDTRLHVPISSLPTDMVEQPTPAPLQALLAWLARLPQLNRKKEVKRRDRWIAKRNPQSEVLPRRNRRQANASHQLSATPLTPALEDLNPPQDWPAEWHSTVKVIAPARPAKARRAVPALRERRVADEEFEGQAFLSLFSENADRMRDLQLLAGDDHVDGPGRDWWRGK
jgi:hypothetical protein